MSRNIQVGPERAGNVEAGVQRHFGVRTRDAAFAVPMAHAGVDQQMGRRIFEGNRNGDAAVMTRFASGSGLTDWRAHRSEGRYDAGRNWSAASLWGRLVRYGRGGDWEQPGFFSRQFNRGLGFLAATGTAAIRPFGTALKTGFRDVPGAVQRGVDRTMPYGLRTATSVLVSGAVLVPALMYGYVKGLWQVCQDIGDGFEGNGLD